MNTTEAVDNGRADERAETITTVPACNAERLLRASVECDGDDGEERDDGRLEGTQEETRGKETSIAPRSTKPSRNRNTPASDDDGQDLAIPGLDENPCGERLHPELGIVADVRSEEHT